MDARDDDAAHRGARGMGADDDGDARAARDAARDARDGDARAALATLTNYEKLGRIGEGTYGVVYKGRCNTTGDVVSLKKVRMDRERDGMPLTSLREVRILQRVRHENVVRLLRVIQGDALNNVFLVFEYCEHDLAMLIDNVKTTLTTSEVKSLMTQTLRAV